MHVLSQQLCLMLFAGYFLWYTQLKGGNGVWWVGYNILRVHWHVLDFKIYIILYYMPFCFFKYLSIFMQKSMQ